MVKKTKKLFRLKLKMKFLMSKLARELKTGLRAEMGKYLKTALRSILVQMEFKMDSRQYSEKNSAQNFEDERFLFKVSAVDNSMLDTAIDGLVWTNAILSAVYPLVGE